MDKPVLRADARRNRARVLAAAEEAFAADGLAVPLDDIARLAGVGAGTVYRHFPSKEALFQAVVLERLAQFAAEARELADAADPGAAFYDYFTRVIKQASLNRAICEALGAASADKADISTEFRDNLTALLERAQAAGAVRADITGDDLRALIVGALAVERYSPGSHHLVRVLLDGLRTV
ncbi:TetR/AcrR family transcriptional regulator [Amycolatopsis sp. FDAARGOS 1241]|uniref:TetR/AcrR family transcriptional regulator n=1 Tax=Amycolatopsis sp. FDAARGOS 1241 TaxID=2778070 RepID=UPI001951F2CA|nr:TetR/AcrR family transcriptional regulator [Amycolatopsis sp. FDAARGOS 1241]QRP45702.1 helix-turn-helix transcriptional regulator [Amycolatopsis sp. FDAARGOS 1241]